MSPNVSLNSNAERLVVRHIPSDLLVREVKKKGGLDAGQERPKRKIYLRHPRPTRSNQEAKVDVIWRPISMSDWKEDVVSTVMHDFRAATIAANQCWTPSRCIPIHIIFSRGYHTMRRKIKGKRDVHRLTFPRGRGNNSFLPDKESEQHIYSGEHGVVRSAPSLGPNCHC